MEGEEEPKEDAGLGEDNKEAGNPKRRTGGKMKNEGRKRKRRNQRNEKIR